MANLETQKLALIQHGMMVSLMVVFSLVDTGMVVFSLKVVLLVPEPVLHQYQMFQILPPILVRVIMDYGIMV